MPWCSALVCDASIVGRLWITLRRSGKSVKKNKFIYFCYTKTTKFLRDQGVNVYYKSVWGPQIKFTENHSLCLIQQST